MRKRAFWAAAILGCLGLAGCVVDREHNRRHWESFKKDVHEIHRTVDRQFLNYDDEDPDRY